MSNIYSTVPIEKYWLSQNFDFPNSKNSSPGQCLASSNSYKTHAKSPCFMLN